MGPGEVLGLVGESGSGKSMTALAAMGLLPPSMEYRAGTVTVNGRQTLSPGERVTRKASDMAMIFQDPRGALNPTMQVGKQLARAIRVNQSVGRKASRGEAQRMLGHVGIPSPQRVFRAYPHQLSGGMCQRVLIGMALACRPSVLLADEPTTALDVTIQAQIFDLLQRLVEDTGCGVVLITHDLAAVAEMCDRVAVIYGGQVMEIAPTRDLLQNPEHPYTRFLLEATDYAIDPRSEETAVDFTLSGCRYANRCQHVFDACSRFPPRVETSAGHETACFLYDDAVKGEGSVGLTRN